MAVDGVGRQTEQLDAALGELGLQTGHLTELGGADGGVVLGVREEDDPAVANVLMEVNGTLGGVGLEVGGNSAQAKARGSSLAMNSQERIQLSAKSVCYGYGGDLRRREGTYGAARSAIVSEMEQSRLKENELEELNSRRKDLERAQVKQEERMLCR